ncbi:MAG: sensor histidine kinase [Planctomycetota bacterium]
MPTRSAVAVLFAVLIAVPVGAAIYLGVAGLQRERTMLVEQERRTMERSADDLRDRLVARLQELYLRELERDDTAEPTAMEPVREYVLIHESEVGSEVAKDLGPKTALLMRGDLAVRVGREYDENFRALRVDADRITRRYLDPVSPYSVVPRVDERLDYAKLVKAQERREEPPGRFGLSTLHYRWIVPPGRNARPVLVPEGYVLELGLHPAATLSAQLGAAEETLLYTLLAVAVVVALGLLFAWRALRAEARLAARKAEFVSAVSHELRTPLTSIRMYADMLKEGWVKDGDAAREYFGLIAAESERLARLVNNVLDFSRIEKGKKGFEMRLGDPGPVIRDVAEVLQPYLKEKGFELELDVPEDLPECSFDKDALTQILVNLIDNAVKYGEREVRLEAEERNGEVVVKVLDRGPGVADDERDRIFEAFTRGRAAGSGGGSGLGLALVQHYADAHEGRVDVSKRDGGGAVFALHLPAA